MKVLIAIPCFDTLPTPFVRSLINLRYTAEVQIAFAQGSLVYDARDQLADMALREKFDRILWIDSDMILPQNAFEKLMADLDDGRGMVSGIYYKRKQPIQPMIFSELTITTHAGGTVPGSKVILDIPEDQIIPIEACGFGCVMMETSYVDKVSRKFGLPFYPTSGFGEDFSFCWRLKELELPIYADTSIQCGHVGQYEYNAKTYEEGRPMVWKTVS